MAIGSKSRVLESARELFYRNGFLATSVDDIIAAAGISKSNFYYHFRTKEDLGLAVLSGRCEELQSALRATLEEGPASPRERLARFLRQVGEFHDQHGGCPFGNLVAEMSEHSERFRAELSAIFCCIAAILEKTVRAGQEAGEVRGDIPAQAVAALIVSAVQGAHLLAKCHKSWEPYEFTCNALLQLLLPVPSVS